ncbi:hypothetical protein [Rhizobium grahamii]|nr:hypothetical protein [Rhizobium grahamii]
MANFWYASVQRAYHALMGAETDLEMVERHVSRGEAIIAVQRSVIEQLSARGSSTTDAEHLLMLFLEIQSQHVAHRNRLTAELGERRLPSEKKP